MTGNPPKISKETQAKRKELIAIYRAAQKDLQARLSSSRLTDFARFRIDEELTQINAIIMTLNTNVKTAMPGMISAYYKYGADLAGVALTVQGVSTKALNLGNRIHTAAIQSVAEQMALDAAKANISMKDTATRILRETQQKLVQEKQINKIVAQGIATGETRRETSARLRKELEDALNGARFVKAGKGAFTPEYYAELVTRTRTREAVTQGAITRSMEFGITLFQVSIHDGPCDICKARQGKVYTIVQGDDSRFPFLDLRPPFHPHCRHVLLPYVLVPGREDKDAALRILSNNNGPIANGLPGYQEAVKQAKLTGGFREKQLPGEPSTKTEPVQTGPTGADVRKKIAALVETTKGDTASINQELAKLYPGNPSQERLAAPLKFKATSSMPKAVAEAKFNEGTSAFFRMVSERSLPQGAFKPEFHSQKSRRAFYSLERQEVNLQHDDKQKTIIHEMGHWLEHKNQRIAKAANDFLEVRTKGETAQSLRSLTGIRGYKANEIAKKDKFKDPYTGKIYPRLTDIQARKYGYTEGLRTTEIASMGLEAMFENPWQFAEDDPDFFDFVWDVIMDGKEYP